MKKLMPCLLCAALLFLFACNNTVDFSVQILRTHQHKSIDTVTTVISTRAELEQYYDSACPNVYYADENHDQHAIQFKEAIEGYTDNFFTAKYLVIVMINEGSGSIGHEVTRIDNNGDIIINRLLPGKDVALTDDEAEWHIVIEFSNSFKPGHFNAVLQDKTVS